MKYKINDLVKVIKNDMSLVIKHPGPKDDEFFDQIGIIIKRLTVESWVALNWYGVLFQSGYYEVRHDAIEVINESR